jgi:hypothetical protein
MDAPFIRRTTYGMRSAPVVEEWVLPGPIKAWRIFHETDVWGGWDKAAAIGNNLTGPEVEECVARIRKHYGYKKNRKDAEGILAISYKWPHAHWGKREFKVWMDDGVEAKEPEHMITRRGPETDICCFDVSWERKGKEVDLHFSTYMHRYSRVSWNHEGGKVVFEDHERQALRSKYEADVKAIEKRASHLRWQAQALYESILRKWHADTLAMIYAEFLEEYADPDLWEGHLKTLTLPEFPIEAQTRYGRGQDFLDWIVDRCVESGLQIEGMTVGEVRDLYFAEVKGKSKRDTKFDQWEDRKEDLPDEILHFRFLAPLPDEEDDEEDEDDN